MGLFDIVKSLINTGNNPTIKDLTYKIFNFSNKENINFFKLNKNREN